MNCPLAPWPQSICYSQYGTNRPFNSAMYLRIQKHKNVQKLKQKHKQNHCPHIYFSFPCDFMCEDSGERELHLRKRKVPTFP